MFGLMQDKPLLISDLLTYAARYHRTREVISRTVEGGFHRYTYPEAAERAAKVANGLLSYGIKPADRIATLAWNTYRHFELFYGVSGIGAVLHTVNPRLFQEQIVYIINHAEDRLVFLDTSFVTQVEAMQGELKTVEAYVILCRREDMPKTTLAPVWCYEDWIAEQSGEITWPSFDERTASSLCYTSGTTGNPKGVLYSHRSTVIHAFQASSNAAMGISVHDAIMPIAPMYHGNGWSLPYIAAMCGANLVLPGPKMDGASIHEVIDRFKVTFSVAVPTVWTMLLEHMEKTGGRIDSLRRVAIGGSAVPRAMIETLRDRYGCTVHQLWGMTETSPLGTMATATPEVEALAPEVANDILCQQGRVQFGLELKLQTPDGAPVPHDGKSFGDLWVRGPWAAAGYFKGEGGQRLDAEGWFPTGDVATIDPYGYLRITDRTKDVIKSGGEWISSIDLENAAYGHASVKMAAVIGIYHPKWEERPLLVVVPADGVTPDKQALLDYLATKVAKWWLPDDIVFVDQIPLTATGKIQKTRLRDQFKDFSLADAS
ncbi:MAG: long-chain-fatty-acid--CoA ligase [Alphaproteobacteria bacterium]|nr:long-chain-fatty-acid--CoA ligase [Alphaproteobacteria bacterium]